MRSPYPFPDPPREIFPGFGSRLAFKLLVVAAVAVRAATWPARLFRRVFPGSAGKPGPDRGVLLLEPFGMGDALLLQPLVLSWLASGRRVALAGKPEWKPMFPPHERFSYLPARPHWVSSGGLPKWILLPLDIVRTAWTLRRAARGSLCICPRGDARAVIALWLSGADEVRTLPRYFSANDCRVSRLAATLVELDRMAPRRIVSRAFAPHGAAYGRPSLCHIRRSGFEAEAAVGSGRRIGIVPKASIPEKEWIPGYWARFVGRLVEKGFSPVAFCGPGEEAAACEALGGADVAIRTVTGPAEWVSLLDSCEAVVSVNTGPMHIADALDKPLVVIDGPSRLPLWAPEGDRSIVLHRQDIAPDMPMHFGRPHQRQDRVMSLVTPQMALQALEELVK